VTRPLVWDDSRTYDRGKVLTGDELEQIRSRKIASSNGNGHVPSIGSGDLPGDDGSNETAGQPMEQFRGKWGRYLDIDNDGIPYRTIPGTHTTYGAFVTRGSSRDEYAVYTEDGDVYRRNMDRLMRKWDTAKELLPQPEFYQEDNPSEFGVLYFGSSKYAAEEAIELLNQSGITLNAMRPRAFPFGKAFRDFIDAHEKIFVIEQNRDAQFKSLMMIELGVDPIKLISVLNYDGMPITADNIFRQIKGNVQ
jgi:2-oxoglutarate ferredoxin oxidoreductase subunit alpha